jgi:hypothetical protein
MCVRGLQSSPVQSSQTHSIPFHAKRFYCNVLFFPCLSFPSCRSMMHTRAAAFLSFFDLCHRHRRRIFSLPLSKCVCVRFFHSVCRCSFLPIHPSIRPFFFFFFCFPTNSCRFTFIQIQTLNKYKYKYKYKHKQTQIQIQTQ